MGHEKHHGYLREKKKRDEAVQRISDKMKQDVSGKKEKVYDLVCG